MDPLSVTLAVISLTTAVKDMVDLGHKIHESFANVSNNLYRAQRVAEEIREMVEEIKNFCEDHKDALANMKDFRMAMQGLLDKFRSFETSILPLIPQTGGRKRDRFIRGWAAWRNNSKVEGSIVDLQSDIVKLMRRHIMKSAMRTEVKLETIHQETSRGFTGVHKDLTQGLEALEVVRRDVSALRLTTTATVIAHCSESYESSWTASDEFNRNVIMFAKSTPSTSGPMLRTPNAITEELMTTAYIKLQVNSIAMSIEKMSELRVSARNINLDIVANFCLSLLLKPASMNIMHLRHHVVRQVTDIRDLLDTKRMHTISIYGSASALNSLSTGLKALHMVHEAILVGKWAITLARMLDDASSGNEPDLSAALALYLLNQSVRYSDSGDKIQSLRAIEEAYTITQNLRNQFEGEVNFQMLHGDVLSQYAQLVDNHRSTQMSIEAVRILEDILGVSAFTQSTSHKNFERVVQPTSSFLNHLLSSAPTIYPIISYARTLQRLGTYSFKGGHPEIALELYCLAISVRRKLVSTHGHEYKAELAMAMSSLMQCGTPGCIPAEELVDMADECVQLLRELVEGNPMRYARQLVSVLWTKATTLNNLDRDTEAIATWEEVASLAGQIIQDSDMCATALGNLSNQFRRLERYEDAVRTGTLAITMYQHGAETQALRYLHLSNDLRELRRYKESVEAARTSVALYRRLLMRDLGTWTSYLTGALSTLARCLAAVGEYSDALIAWKESVSILDNFLNTDLDKSSAVIEQYLSALSIHPSFSKILEDEEDCLKVCSTAARFFHQMSETYPPNANVTTALKWTEFYYAYNMLRFGSLQDGLQYIDHWLDVWSSKPSEALSEPEIAAWYAMMVTLKADILDAQGCTEQALLTNRKVNDVVKLSATAYQPYSSLIIDSMVRDAQLRVKLGKNGEALQVAEGALRLAQAIKSEPNFDDLVLSLHQVAITASSCQNYQRAIEAAREGCNIYATSPNRWNSGREHDISIYPSLFALISFAEANLGRLSFAVEYAHRAVNMSLDIRDMRGHISATTAERSYMDTRGNLAEIFIATGDLAQARQIFEETRAYFAKRVEKRMGDYRELAPTLRMLGVLYCNEGRHEEGEATAKELSQIIRMLCSAFSSLQEQVKNRLRNHVKVPILKVLEEMSQKLDCQHQTEVASLYTS